MNSLSQNKSIMQEAIPYRPCRPLHTHSLSIDNNNNNNNNNISFSVSTKGISRDQGMVHNMVIENAVLVFGRRGCCMTHVVKRLLLGLGVNPAVYEVEEKDEVGVARELEAIGGGCADIDKDGKQGKVQFPKVFIGGKLFGGLDRLMATHISGELVPLLKQAGALWL